jgi:hypothetical protein
MRAKLKCEQNVCVWIHFTIVLQRMALQRIKLTRDFLAAGNFTTDVC